MAVSSVKTDHPNAGEVMVLGHLHAKGIHVPRAKICHASAIHRLDPLGPTECRRPPIRRWVYSVPCPNYVWHIDGNHKLIKWHLVVHHGIGGSAAWLSLPTIQKTTGMKQFFHPT